MPFNSFSFLFLFLPAVSILYYISAQQLGTRTAQVTLVLSSLVFYSLGNPVYTPLLLGSILFNCTLSQMIARSEGKRRRGWLVSGLAGNIAVLAVFKYIKFLFGSVAFFWKPAFALPDWTFPLGISFFTLQQVMYLVDCHEELIAPNSLITHAAFVSFFPSVISGPITQARRMVPQIQQAVTTDAEKVSRALVLFAIGLVKKVVLADAFGRIADGGFSAAAHLSTVEAWLSSFAYTFQIYFDFGGYTDLAIGAALLLGFTLPINFNTPYRSLSITEFWQRWHITLSQFITTYLFTPIARSFKKLTLAKASLTTILVMTIVGLWHGPSWTFVIFGALHGLGLAANQVWRKKVGIKVPPLPAWVATMLFLNLAFVFFRAPDVHTALQLCRALLPQHNLASLQALKESIRLVEMWPIVVPVTIGVIAALVGRNSTTLSQQLRPRLVTACGVASLILLSLLYMNSNLAKQFIYFKF